MTKLAQLASLTARKPSPLDESSYILVPSRHAVKFVDGYLVENDDEARTVVFEDQAVARKTARLVGGNVRASGYRYCVAESLNEDTELQGLGKALKTAPKTASTPAPKEEPAPEAETPEGDQTPDPETDVQPEDKWAIDQIVKPKIGPHKGELHTIVKVFPNGSVLIEPKDLKGQENKYRNNQIIAKSDQIELVEDGSVKESITKENLFKSIVLEETEWQVVVDTGPHQSTTYKIKAKTSDEAYKKAVAKAKKDRLPYPSVNNPAKLSEAGRTFDANTGKQVNSTVKRDEPRFDEVKFEKGQKVTVKKTGAEVVVTGYREGLVQTVDMSKNKIKDWKQVKGAVSSGTAGFQEYLPRELKA